MRFVSSNQPAAPTPAEEDLLRSLSFTQDTPGPMIRDTEDGPFTRDVRVGDVPIRIGGHLTFVFDFGDWWEFDLWLEGVHPDDAQTVEPVVLETHGKAPSQYFYDEE